jgi:hypothetical protein
VTLAVGCACGGDASEEDPRRSPTIGYSQQSPRRPVVDASLTTSCTANSDASSSSVVRMLLRSSITLRLSPGRVALEVKMRFSQYAENLDEFV